MVINGLIEGARGLAFVLEVNLLMLGIAAVGLLTAAVVVLPFALGAAAWEGRDRKSFTRWGRVVGMILALLALLFLPSYGFGISDFSSTPRATPTELSSREAKVRTEPGRVKITKNLNCLGI
jgi:hypothetical protein